MKKFWFRTAAVFMAVCMLIGMSVIAYAGERLDIVLNSGDVVEEEQYYTKNDYDPTDYKCVNSVVFNAYGSEPIIVKRYAFAGFDFGDNVWSITFNGTGEIRLGSYAFIQTEITDLDIPSNVVFDEDAFGVFADSCLKTVKISCALSEGIFTECEYLESVTFSDDFVSEEIPRYAFDGCSKTKSITIPSTVKKIDDSAFSYNGLENIVFNEGLESIGDNAFNVAFCLSYIKFPSSLKSIGNSSFRLGSLKTVVLNQGLEKIGEYAFAETSIKSVVIPSSVTEIGTKAFGYNSMSKVDGFTIYGYSGTAAETYAVENGFTFIPLDNSGDLINVVLNSGDVVEKGQFSSEHVEGSIEYPKDPNFKCINSVVVNAYGTEPVIIKKDGFSGSYWADNVWSVAFNGTGEIRLGQGAFRDTKITDLNIPSNVVYDEGATDVFNNCAVKSVEIGGSLCEGNFSECKYLESVYFLNSSTVEEIPKCAFEYCGRLKNIKVPASVKKIGDSAFEYSGLNSIELNEGLEIIENDAFGVTNGLTYVKFPSTLKSVGKYSFELSGLKRVDLNDGLETIDEKAFFFNDNLTYVRIPKSVTYIGEKAFGYIGETSKVDGFKIYGYIGTAAETYAKENGFTFIPIENDDGTIDVLLNSGDVVEEGQYYYLRSEENAPTYGFEYDPDFKCVKNVTFNATGTDPIIVNDLGFAGCYTPNNVQNITFNGSGEIRIGSLAFYLTQITDLDLPSNVVFDEDAHSVFSESKVKTAKIGCAFCPYMFEMCNYLESVTFTNKISVIPENAFDFCLDLKEITLPSSVRTIEKNAFIDSGLRSISLNNGLERIGEYAFMDCYGLKSVVIPSSVKEIGTQAFGYDSLEKIDGFTIYGYSGTAAETYAVKNGITFIPLEDNVTDVTYTPTWGSVNDYGFTVSGRADKLQVIEANGGTRTVTRNSPNVVIKSYDINGNEVNSLSRELDYEVWTVNTRLTPDTELQVHAKYNNEWVDATYRFSVSTLYSDKTLKKAELSATSGGQGIVNCNIVTGSGVSKVRVEYEDGMTSTYHSGYATLDVENMTYTYDITVKAYRTGEIPYKIYIKTPSGWQYATTLTYTAE